MPGGVLAGCDSRMKSGDGGVYGLIGEPVVLEEGSENGNKVGGQNSAHVACPEKVCAGAMSQRQRLQERVRWKGSLA